MPTDYAMDATIVSGVVWGVLWAATAIMAFALGIGLYLLWSMKE